MKLLTSSNLYESAPYLSSIHGNVAVRKRGQIFRHATELDAVDNRLHASAALSPAKVSDTH